MTHPFDDWPAPWPDPLLGDVQRTLADAFRLNRDLMHFALGIPPPFDVGRLEQGGSTLAIARSIIDEAYRTGQTRRLVELLGDAQPRLALTVEQWLSDRPPRSTPEDDAPPNRIGTIAAERVREQILVTEPGRNVDIAFLEKALAQARSVCQLRIMLGDARFVATGFRIADDLIMTTDHVVEARDGSAVDRIEAWFGYEVGADSHLRAPTVVHCDVSTLRSERDSGWAVIRTSSPVPDEFPSMPINVPAIVRAEDPVFAIHHPEGRPKTVEVGGGVVRHVDDDVVRYLISAGPGSSGAPIFDRDWNVIAVHRQWILVDVDGTEERQRMGPLIHRIRESMLKAGVAT